jgi:hypothetical protein
MKMIEGGLELGVHCLERIIVRNGVYPQKCEK